jgi:subtilisin-like proprotein convertase family protein
MDQNSAWQLVERLWYETRPGSGGDAYFCHLPLSDSCGETTWYQKMRVADDDDGDLSNGTPHAAELFAAFARHDIACGDVDDPANQSTSSCPTLDAPVLTATDLPGGTELTWGAVSGAAEYRVYRGELGCNRQQVPIASLTGGETSFLDTEADPGLPRFYRVEAFGSNPACFSPVSNCEATPPGALLNHQTHRVDDSDHDSDGMPEPGETFKLPVTLFNTGVESSMATGARLSLISPSQVRVLGPDATWTDIPPSTMLESNDPHFEVTVLEDAACGEVLTLTYDAWAANAAPITQTLEFPMGDAQRDFLKTTYVSIPPVTTEPATSTQVIGDDQTIAELDFSIFLDNHQDPTQLIVELTSPEGTTVRVHDRSAGSGTGIDTRYDLLTVPDGPGTMADFVGESTQGTWTVSVEDVDSDGPTNNARLLRWTLHTTVEGAFDCQVKTCPEPVPTEAPELTVETAANGSEIDLVFSWNPVAGAAGYHVLQSTSAAFDDSVELLGRTTSETTHTEADGVNTTPDLTFFQVRGTNSCNQEGP